MKPEPEPDPLEELVRRMQQGDSAAAAELFERHRSRLRRLVQLRLDRRLQGRLDPSDVLQEAFLDIQKKASGYAAEPKLPVYLWLRLILTERLLLLHRFHLGTLQRDAGREIALRHEGLLPADTESLANLLLGRMTSPSAAAIRAERQLRLQEALNQMDPVDREVLALRHFEELSNAEVAEVLHLSKQASSNRYLRALKRLKEILQAVPGMAEGE